MSLETAQYINQLNPANPSGADRLKEGDDHLRLIKSTLLNTFPGIAGPLDASVTDTFLNGLASLLVPIGAITLWQGADTAVPTGWAICNGQTVTGSDGTTKVVTPDMRDRVAVGASTTNVLLSTFGANSKTVTSGAAGGHTPTATTVSAGAHDHGGTQGHALTVAELAAHSHYEFANSGGSYNSIADSPEGAPNSSGTGSSSGASYGIGGSGGTATVGKTSSTGTGTAHSHGIASAGDHTHTINVAAVADHSHSLTIDVTQAAIALHYIIKV